MTIDVGLIGGTGVGWRLAALGGKPLVVPTRYGPLRGKMFDHGGKQVVAMQRHSLGHKTPPHLVNYRAMAAGLAKLGAKACFASAAVGSLRPDWPKGTLVVCSDALDLTGRRLTMFDRVVKHTDMSHPFPAREQLLVAAQDIGVEVEDGGVYVAGDGPRYETPQEIKVIGQMGGDLVGMTASTEAILMREAGVPYACLAVVTNLAAGLTPSELHHGEVEDAMQERGETVVDILLRAVCSV